MESLKLVTPKIITHSSLKEHRHIQYSAYESACTAVFVLVTISVVVLTVVSEVKQEMLKY